MASLLNKTTSSQLGIGQGDAGDFATGVKKKKKVQPKRTQAEAIEQQKGNEAADARLKAQADIDVSYDPTDDGANFQMNTDDQNFINQIQDIKSGLFAGNYKGGGGARGQAAGFFETAAASSRGGLGEIWEDTLSAIYKGDMGPKKLALAQEQFTKAYEKTSQYLNLDVDQSTYQFDQGAEETALYGKDLIRTEGKGKRKDYQAAKKLTRQRAKGKVALPEDDRQAFAWDVAADAGQDQLGIGSGSKKASGLSIR